jgi:hypothetical protein
MDLPVRTLGLEKKNFNHATTLMTHNDLRYIGGQALDSGFRSLGKPNRNPAGPLADEFRIGGQEVEHGYSPERPTRFNQYWCQLIL